MIRIETGSYNAEEVRQSFLREFAKMILCGMSVPRSDGNVEQAMDALEGELEFAVTDTGFTAGNEDPDYDFTAQDCAFTVASEVFGKNSYDDSFGGDEACMTFVAGQLLEQYPGIEIEAQMFLDTNWSNTVEIVKTVDGGIETEIEEF